MTEHGPLLQIMTNRRKSQQSYTANTGPVPPAPTLVTRPLPWHLARHSLQTVPVTGPQPNAVADTSSSALFANFKRRSPCCSFCMAGTHQTGTTYPPYLALSCTSLNVDGADSNAPTAAQLTHPNQCRLKHKTNCHRTAVCSVASPYWVRTYWRCVQCGQSVLGTCLPPSSRRQQLPVQTEPHQVKHIPHSNTPITVSNCQPNPSSAPPYPATLSCSSSRFSENC
jgi:hypothetical protein